jgi:hypothetical protein
MNELLAHRWGLSTAQDRVWAHVTGLAPRYAVRRLLMVLQFQAFVDESISSEEFVLGGYIAPAAVWAQFSRDWEEILPLGIKDKNGAFYFKMSEMALGDERMARVQSFYNIIEKYDGLIPISLRMNLVDFENAKRRVHEFARGLGWTIDFQTWDNPYYFAFRLLLDHFHTRSDVTEKSVPQGETVDFIFDDRTEKKYILAAWDEIAERMSEDINRPFGSAPRFEDDRKFLPLQAADLWAWWVREWYEEDASPVPDKLKALDFRSWKGRRRWKLVMSASEDELIRVMKGIAVENFAVGNYRHLGGD